MRIGAFLALSVIVGAQPQVLFGGQPVPLRLWDPRTRPEYNCRMALAALSDESADKVSMDDNLERISNDESFIRAVIDSLNLNRSVRALRVRLERHKKGLHSLSDKLVRYPGPDDGFSKAELFLPIAFSHEPTLKRWKWLQENLSYRVGLLTLDDSLAFSDFQKGIIRLPTRLVPKEYIDPNVLFVHEVADSEFTHLTTSKTGEPYPLFLQIVDQIGHEHPELFRGPDSANQIWTFLREIRSYRAQFAFYRNAIEAHPEILSPGMHNGDFGSYFSDPDRWREYMINTVFPQTYGVPPSIARALWSFDLPIELR